MIVLGKMTNAIENVDANPVVLMQIPILAEYTRHNKRYNCYVLVPKTSEHARRYDG